MSWQNFSGRTGMESKFHFHARLISRETLRLDRGEQTMVLAHSRNFHSYSVLNEKGINLLMIYLRIDTAISISDCQKTTFCRLHFYWMQAKMRRNSRQLNDWRFGFAHLLLYSLHWPRAFCLSNRVDVVGIINFRDKDLLREMWSRRRGHQIPDEAFT